MKADTFRHAGRLALWREVMVSSPPAAPRGEPGVNYIQLGLWLAAACRPRLPPLPITSLDAGRFPVRVKGGGLNVRHRRGQTDGS